MNMSLHKSSNRGHVNMGWLDARHSFSFGSWQDPRYMGVSVLRVINEDRIAARGGFGQHGHDNMEILTYVLSGQLSHTDSMGNQGHINAGEWQLMSAGSGVQHSEMNQTDSPVHLLQIWLYPNVQNAEPTYQQIQLDPRDQPNQWHLVVSPNREHAPLLIRQNARILGAWLEQGQHLQAIPEHGVSYIHVIQGHARINDQVVSDGDAVILNDPADIQADTDTHLIWFDLPKRLA
ncbi:MAG: pirin family protein [Pseudomonadota bacterium]|nr:pirin family protein [Pseudomonadota bacterium]